MIKYYCNRCQSDITKQDRYIVQVKHEDKQCTYHFCANCYKEIAPTLQQVKSVDNVIGDDNGNPVPVQQLEDIPKEPVGRKKPYQGLTIKDDLPVMPSRRANLSLIHRVLVQYYMGTEPRVVMSRNQINYQKYFQVINRYGSEKIRQKYQNIHVFVNNVSVADVLTLYTAGFSEKTIAEEELDCSEETVRSIISEYTGL